MITFFDTHHSWYAVQSDQPLSGETRDKLIWLFGGAQPAIQQEIMGTFTGPREEMITPWSTNAVEITQNMGISGITRVEEFIFNPGFESRGQQPETPFDPMLQQQYVNLGQALFRVDRKPEPVRFIGNIGEYNRREGLALSSEEVNYLESVCLKIGRKLTDSEVFGFSQVNSEHCRHKIFNGTFIIDGKEMSDSLFDLIKKTAKVCPNFLVSAYKDNVAFIKGPRVEQFAPENQHIADYFAVHPIDTVISLKAETHNFPTTVEPFNGAATGSGGEIRDRMAGGKGSIPVAGTAVYMTSYPRLEPGREWEQQTRPRSWLYQTPGEILIKASNGASDFGNKFGQPLICGSVLTFEHEENGKVFGFDKVIMLAGGIGFAREADALKNTPEAHERIVVLGGDNYRIGMGGGAVSSVATGEFANAIELNAVQRSNPEMQKRVFNVIRALSEMGHNPVVSIHDHGAGGHLNSISELVEESGGVIHIDRLPVGDSTLSNREIISNESQERMGLILKEEDLPLVHAIALRERSPLYDVGHTTGDHALVFEDGRDGSCAIDLQVADFFGKPPKTIMKDVTSPLHFAPVTRDKPDDQGSVLALLKKVLQLEAVACKDWLTNKVDRAVSGKIALQQTCGPVQLPLNNLGVTALDYQGISGMAISIGHAPVAGLIDPAAASRLSVAEALTNIVWAPLTHGLQGVSLSANWMWPAKNPGEDARLYQAVQALSDFCIALGINIPTGKDSLSMTQKYPDGKVVYSPGTVIISAVAEVSDVKRVVTPNLLPDVTTTLIYIPFSSCGFHLGGSSAAQVMNRVGVEVPDAPDAEEVRRAFDHIQMLVSDQRILAGHDVSAGGLITTLLEMTFSSTEIGMDLDLTSLGEDGLEAILFSEKPGVVIQTNDPAMVTGLLKQGGVSSFVIGKPVMERALKIRLNEEELTCPIDELRDAWFHTSYLLDRLQSGENRALERFANYKRQPLRFSFPGSFTGTFAQCGIDPARRRPTGIRGAIIREKGVNRDREMAWAMYLAGFDVKDVHMTDLIAGRETLDDIQFIAFVGGFSNSDVLGSAKGWAGAFLYNETARETLNRFYARADTLSLGVCNGCQLMVELGLVYPSHAEQPRMVWNDSRKYECAFVGLDIRENRSVMLQSLAGSRLGIWVAHGEGKFYFPYTENRYHIPAVFSYPGYPGNPNGSMYDAACIVSEDGRHLAIMPHLEDSVLPWQWAWYPPDRRADEVTPWIEAFTNAKDWLIKRKIS